MVQPAFHKKKLEGLLGIMQQAIQTELQRIAPQTDADIFPLMGDLAFQVVAKSLFSRSDIRDRMQQLQEFTEKNQKMLIREMRQPYFKWWFHLSGQIRHHLAFSRKGRIILNELIEERLRSGLEKDDLLDMLLKARYEDDTAMSREQLIDEVMILFTAGHETTANALSFTFFLLAKHPEFQEKAFQEVVRAKDGEVDLMAFISKLPFIKQCIEEALRLYPPAYIIDRVAIEDDLVEGRVIPKNTLILMSIYELHRHSRFWDAPDAYRPERFDADQVKDLQEYYYPFGAGPRMCVGNNFAMYEMILTVAQILKNYTLTTNSESVEINPLISLKPKEVIVRFTQRENFD
jgi:cytochrome P450